MAAFFGEAALDVLPLIFRGETHVEASLSNEGVFNELLEGCFLTDLVALGSATSTKSPSSSCPKAAAAAPLLDAAAFVVEVFLATLPELTVSAAASCAFAEGTTRLGEDLLVNGSGLADFDFALLDFVGEVLRLDALAGVPSARAFAIVAGIKS